MRAPLVADTDNIYPVMPLVLKATVKRHRGEPGHKKSGTRTRDTRDTRVRAHAGTYATRITQTNHLTTIHPNPTTHPHDHATAETAADSIAARTAAGPESTCRPLPRDRSPRPTQKRPPQANPTLPPPASRAPTGTRYLADFSRHSYFFTPFKFLPPFFQLLVENNKAQRHAPMLGCCSCDAVAVNSRQAWHCHLVPRLKAQ